jgi:hypothetical protein
VERCVFRNIGNAKLSHSVGGIDFEPDHDWSVYRNVRIAHCRFIDIDTVNTAGITFFNGHQTGDNIHDWTVSDCEFSNCYWGIDSSTKAKTPADRPDNLRVLNCDFLNSIRVDVAVKGLGGTQISGCTFRRSPAGSGPGGDAIRLGTIASRTSRNAIDTVITGNTFTGIRPQMGVIGILGADGLVCTGNVFSDIHATCINFAEDRSPDDKRTIGRIVISGNVVRHGARAGSMSFLSTSNGMRISKGRLTLGHSYEYANDIGPSVRKIANGATIAFRGAAPAS